LKVGLYDSDGQLPAITYLPLILGEKVRWSHPSFHSIRQCAKRDKFDVRHAVSERDVRTAIYRPTAIEKKGCPVNVARWRQDFAVVGVVHLPQKASRNYENRCYCPDKRHIRIEHEILHETLTAIHGLREFVFRIPIKRYASPK
jgi:hypothetical protein